MNVVVFAFVFVSVVVLDPFRRRIDSPNDSPNDSLESRAGRRGQVEGPGPVDSLVAFPVRAERSCFPHPCCSAGSGPRPLSGLGTG